MNRYIEIIYDNSGSMNDYIGNKPKYEIAQELFEKEILPTIAIKGDHIVLRLLRKECASDISYSESFTQLYGTNRKKMLERIKEIHHDQSTPLFYTIADAINACKTVIADKYLIFVLTDGDDTCTVKMEELIDQDIIDKYVKYYDVLLAQLAINSKTSSNNLTALTSYLGGQTVLLESKDSITSMRNKLKKGLTISGFSTKLPIEHCYTHQPGFDLSWDEIQNKGIDFHQVLYLYHKGVLSWQPDISKQVSAIELSELKFLFALYYTTAVPESLILTMLAQLKKPYYYSHDCIYWDFSVARWKYFAPQNLVKQVDNPDAQTEDGQFEAVNKMFDDELETETYDHNELQTYDEYQVYRVDYANTDAPAVVLKPLGRKSKWNIELKLGDLVKFKIK